MRRHGVVLISTVLGLGAIVAAGAAAAGFGSQGSARSFARVKQVRPNTATKRAASLAQLRGVNFVSGCRFSHRNTDDPIVYPGQPGKSHDHTFIGNDTTDAFSTLGTMLGATSSCRRAGDTAGYWVPTLVSATGEAIEPRTASVYYRRRTLSALRAFPPGFKLIAGNSNATAPQGLRVTSWNCGPAAEVRPQSTIPTCPNAGRAGLALHVQFPNCWDGASLDSPDHQSHMAYSARGRCPAGHPVAVPAIQVNIRYPSTGGPGFQLASGGQLSGHADFFNAWDAGTLQQLVDGCLNALRHCQQGV
jgi:Domain of unknown function (DUF1996)